MHVVTKKERGLVVVPNSSVERQWQRLTVRGEDGKNYALHVQTCQLLHPTSLTEFVLKDLQGLPDAKVTTQKSSKRAGATPLFGGRSAQKFCGVTPPGTQEE